MDANHRCARCGDFAVEVGRLRKSGMDRQAEQQVLACSRCQEVWEARSARGPYEATGR
jgi:hypothetical protein